jgi:hypothetical protein
VTFVHAPVLKPRRRGIRGRRSVDDGVCGARATRLGSVVDHGLRLPRPRHADAPRRAQYAAPAHMGQGKQEVSSVWPARSGEESAAQAARIAATSACAVTSDVWSTAFASSARVCCRPCCRFAVFTTAAANGPPPARALAVASSRTRRMRVLAACAMEPIMTKRQQLF